MNPYYYVLQSSFTPWKIICKTTTRKLAKEESERLALKYPGESFEILQCLGITSTGNQLHFEKPVEVKEGEVLNTKGLKLHLVPRTFWMDGVSPETGTSLYSGEIKTLCECWAEDHTHLQNLCREVGYSEDEVEGNSYGVPGIMDLADMLRSKIPPSDSPNDKVRDGETGPRATKWKILK